MLKGAALGLAMTVAIVAVWITVIFTKAVQETIKSDIKAVLPRAACITVKVLTQLLPEADREEGLAWFAGEFDKIRRDGGSGVGLAMAYVVIMVQRAIVIRLRREGSDSGEFK